MTQRGGKTFLAVGVLLAGTVAAMLFRHPPTPSPAPVEQANSSLLLRKEVGPAPDVRVADRPTVRIESPLEPRNVPIPPPANRLPADPEPAPELAKTYPGSGTLTGEPADRDANNQSPALPRNAAAARTHKIVDGDTLSALALRYLGRSDRYLEIFEANKDVLSNPGLLPIGAVLKIPAAASQTDTNAVRGSQRPLVPVPASDSPAATRAS